jgi:adenylate cyclase
MGAANAPSDRALLLNPNYARGWHISGNFRLAAGQPDIAIQYYETSLRLSPRARTGSTSLVMGIAHFFCRRFDEAVPRLRLAIQENPSRTTAYQFLAACFAHMGRLDEAREIVERCTP